MKNNIGTVSGRARLAPRRDPYWVRITAGCYLGFRRMNEESEGTWSIRGSDASTGKRAYRTLGSLGELPNHERYEAAYKAAREWFTHLSRGGLSTTSTVGDACRDYLDYLAEHKPGRNARETSARFGNYVLNDRRLAEMDIAKLTPQVLDAWRKRLRDTPTRSGANVGGKRTVASLGRDMTCLRAALNLAFERGHVTTDFAWRGALKPPKDSGGRRELYLDRAQRRELIAAARPDLAAFLHALALMPLRPGALAALTAGDYDRRLQVVKIGKDKVGKDRKIRLPTDTAELFAAASAGKLPLAPLLSRANGKAWDKDAWKRMVKTAVTKAKLPPATSAYTVRHSTITDLVVDGLDLMTVAMIAGTSIGMIEKHYGHLRGDVASAALAKLAL